MSLLKVQNQLDSLQAQVDALKQIQDLSVRASADGTEYIVVNVSGVDYKMLASTFFATPTVEKGLSFTLSTANKNGRILITSNSVQMTIPTSLGWAKGDYCWIELGGTGFTMSTSGVTINSPATLDDTQYSIYFIVKTDTDVFTIAQLGVSGGGDMTKAVYDPTNVNGDAFNMDNMVEGSTNKILTQAERDAIAGIGNPTKIVGNWDASTGIFPGGGTAESGDSYIVSVSGTVDGVSFSANDRIIAITDNASTSTFAANWFKADYTDVYQTDPEIETAYNNQVGQVTSGEKTAGTETAVRRFSPKDVKEIVENHTHILNDTTPQLGGELDMNGHSVGGDAQTATGDGTTTIDWKLGNFFHFQFGAFDEAFTFTAPTKPGTFILKMVQDSVGSRTATWPGTVKWPGGTAPTLTTTATTGTDIITFYYDGTSYFGIDALNFS